MCPTLSAKDAKALAWLSAVRCGGQPRRLQSGNTGAMQLQEVSTIEVSATRGILEKCQHLHLMVGQQDPPAEQVFPSTTLVFLTLRLFLAIAAPAQRHPTGQTGSWLLAEAPCNPAVCCCCAWRSQPDRSLHSQWLHTAARLDQTAAMLQTSMMALVLGCLAVCCCCEHKQDTKAATQLLPGKGTQTAQKCL